MTSSLHLPFTIYRCLPINYQVSFGKLANDKLLKIENCELRIAIGGSL